MFDDSELPPPRGYVSPLRRREDPPPVDTGVSVPVGAVDFEQDAEVEQPEVSGSDETVVTVADGELLDVPDTGPVEDPSNALFQLGNNRHAISVAPDLPVAQVIEGDCIEVMRTLPANSIDAVCADPPYGLTFMGQEFDDPKHMEASLGRYSVGAGVTSKPGIGERDVEWPSNAGWNAYRCKNCGHLSHGGSPCQCKNPEFVPADNRWLVYQHWTETWAREAYRILKPGGALVVFGGTRTHHRQTVAIEDAGFEIRDEMQWVYLSGMPKSRAQLKPAHEPILLARKPMIGSMPRNMEVYGTGELGIEEARIPLQDGEEYVINTFDDGAKPFGNGAGHPYTSRTETKGRWPSNILLTDAEVFDGGVEGVVGGGERSSGMMKAGTQRSTRSIDYGKMPDTANLADTYGDTGGISRFFIVPKAARSEKEPMFDPESELKDTTTIGPMAGRGQPGLKCRKCGHWKISGNPCRCDEPDFEPVPFERPAVKNNHPTVKPLDLICHLVRLVCPRGGVVLDPFLGSGTTAKAAEIEGRQWIGIERDPHFARIARARLAGQQQGLGLE